VRPRTGTCGFRGEQGRDSQARLSGAPTPEGSSPSCEEVTKGLGRGARKQKPRPKHLPQPPLRSSTARCHCREPAFACILIAHCTLRATTRIEERGRRQQEKNRTSLTVVVDGAHAIFMDCRVYPPSVSQRWQSSRHRRGWTFFKIKLRHVSWTLSLREGRPASTSISPERPWTTPVLTVSRHACGPQHPPTKMSPKDIASAHRRDWGKPLTEFRPARSYNLINGSCLHQQCDNSNLSGSGDSVFCWKLLWFMITRNY